MNGHNVDPADELTTVDQPDNDPRFPADFAATLSSTVWAPALGLGTAEQPGGCLLRIDAIMRRPTTSFRTGPKRDYQKRPPPLNAAPELAVLCHSAALKLRSISSAYSAISGVAPRYHLRMRRLFVVDMPMTKLPWKPLSVKNAPRNGQWRQSQVKDIAPVNVSMTS
jgi:hypothetical protein